MSSENEGKGGTNSETGSDRNLPGTVNIGNVFSGNQTTDAPPPAFLQEATERFHKIHQQIYELPDDDEIDKIELMKITDELWRETNKGDSANSKRLERWLRLLAGASPEIFKTTAMAIIASSPKLTKTVKSIELKLKLGMIR